jgi:NAD(P)H dehydrogenase (quinone)
VLVAAPEHVRCPLSRDPWPARSGAPGGEAAVGFTNSGAKYGDKPSTLTWFATLAALHGMYWVNLLLPRPLVSP